jgi:hypothetical protein
MRDISKSLKWMWMLPLIAGMVACNPSLPESHADDHFTDLFSIDSDGITGADGCISFPLSNGSSIFMMGDSFLDPVVDGKRDTGLISEKSFTCIYGNNYDITGKSIERNQSYST